ncbi:putative SP-containing membrane protein [Vairimorpha necatrix]|uniref:SP-containing membrane protein n=1 Tax=Vairimorpha necatrix TaxID=6039 RepID=A0AAX4JGA6_9MICR
MIILLNLIKCTQNVVSQEIKDSSLPVLYIMNRAYPIGLVSMFILHTGYEIVTKRNKYKSTKDIVIISTLAYCRTATAIGGVLCIANLASYILK